MLYFNMKGSFKKRKNFKRWYNIQLQVQSQPKFWFVIIRIMKILQTNFCSIQIEVKNFLTIS